MLSTNQLTFDEISDVHQQTYKEIWQISYLSILSYRTQNLLIYLLFHCLEDKFVRDVYRWPGVQCVSRLTLFLVLSIMIVLGKRNNCKQMVIITFYEFLSRYDMHEEFSGLFFRFFCTKTVVAAIYFFFTRVDRKTGLKFFKASTKLNSSSSTYFYYKKITDKHF